MKIKLVFLLSLLAGLTFTTSKIKAQAVEEGNVMIDAYYGFPNLMTSLFRSIAETSTDDPNLQVKGLGPFGAKASYMLTDNIGLGVDFFYARSSFEYTDIGSDSLGNATTYTYKFTSTRPRFLLRMDYHFGNSDMLDPYLGIGLGYSASRYKLTTTDPYFDINQYSTRILIPVAYRIAFGTKIYFAPFLGATVEVGLGGPLLTVGLSGKF